MSGYLGQLLPQSTRGTPEREPVNHNADTILSEKPSIEFLSIFNPTLISDGDHSDEELSEQILCFIENGGCEEENIERRLKNIGLISGIETLSRDFLYEDRCSFVIRGKSVSTLVEELEEDYYIVVNHRCKTTDEKDNTSNNQMSVLLNQYYLFFKLYNSSFGNMLKTYGKDVLSKCLEEFWSSFMICYNELNFASPKSLMWPNFTNYKGFLGTLPKHGRSFKKSTIKLNVNTENQLENLLGQNRSDKTLKGLLVSYLNKEEPKETGVVFMQTASNEPNSSSFSIDSLIDVHNLVEHQYFRQNLNEEHPNDLSTTFAVNDRVKTSVKNDYTSIFKHNSSSSSSEIAQQNMQFLSSNLELLNPITITNNLVVNPLNFTYNSVKNMASNVPTNANDTSRLLSNATSFFKRDPNYVSPDERINHLRDTTSNEEDHIDQDNEDENLQAKVEDRGMYLYGIETQLTLGCPISRNLVYLSSTCSDSNNTTIQKEMEYSIIIYKKESIYVTLIYDSSNMELDTNSFYSGLSCQVLEPLTDDIYLSLSDNNPLSNSINSLRSLDRYVHERNKGIQEKDGVTQSNEFFFISFQRDEKWIKSSLPYLPLMEIGENNILNRVKLKAFHSLIYLHDELTALLNHDSNEFLENDSSMNEYFHKFNNTRSKNWMFYYIKHKSTFTIIIKNHTSNQGGSNKLHANNSEIATKAQYDQHFLSKLATDVYGYANLGFLDSLGDDVKIWLEGFHVSEEH